MAKRLDYFLNTEKIMERFHFIRQWVGSGGHFDHYPIFTEFKNGHVKPPSPLKFNKTWLKDETFLSLNSSKWIPFDPVNTCTSSFQFASNFRNLKDAIKDCSVAKRRRENCELKLIEKELYEISDRVGGV